VVDAADSAFEDALKEIESIFHGASAAGATVDGMLCEETVRRDFVSGGGHVEKGCRDEGGSNLNATTPRGGSCRRGSGCSGSVGSSGRRGSGCGGDNDVNESTEDFFKGLLGEESDLFKGGLFDPEFKNIVMPTSIAELDDGSDGDEPFSSDEDKAATAPLPHNPTASSAAPKLRRRRNTATDRSKLWGNAVALPPTTGSTDEAIPNATPRIRRPVFRGENL